MDMKIQKNDTVRNTAAAAAVGASIGTLCNYATQKHILKNPDSVIDTFTKHIAELTAREAKTKFEQELKESKIRGTREYIQTVQELVKGGKINNKMLTHAAITGAIIIGCGYLVGKQIKNIFKKFAKNPKTELKDNL